MTPHLLCCPPISLAVGTRLGVCEVLGPLGAGAMGEVSRARDTRLPRDVARPFAPRLSSVLQIFDPYASARLQVATRHLDPREKSRVILEAVVEPIVL